MIKSVTATNYLGESLTFELGKPDETGIYVQSIDGLGPVAATINTTELSSSDGSVFNSARLNQRNIVMNFGLMFNPIIEDMRHRLYKFFPLKKPVRIDVLTDRRKCYTIGYVETNNPNIFSKEETQQVSIICPTPWLYGIVDGMGEIDLYYISKTFEFPFPLLGDTIEFGEIQNYTSVSFNYEGDDETGMLFTLHFQGTVTADFTIADAKTNERLTIKSNADSAGGFHFGDTLYISTIKGQKYVRLQPNSSTELQNKIVLLDRDSDWLSLRNGENEIGIFSETEGVTDLIKASIDYNILYMGV